MFSDSVESKYKSTTENRKIKQKVNILLSNIYIKEESSRTFIRIKNYPEPHKNHNFSTQNYQACKEVGKYNSNTRWENNSDLLRLTD